MKDSRFGPAKIGLIFSILISIALFSCRREEVSFVPLIKAHSHNDYLRPRPLWDALEAGFLSLEADIIFHDNQLVLAHEVSTIDPARTLKSLYLEPLYQRVLRHGGWVYPSRQTCLLIVDIKSDPTETYRHLLSLLAQYESMLTHFTSDKMEIRAVTVIISGEVPQQILEQEPYRLVARDGRWADLKENPPLSLVPLVSEDWSRIFSNRRIDQIKAEEKITLKNLVTTAHQQGRLIRLWGVPEDKKVWAYLNATGLDFISTDNIPKFRSFFSARPRTSWETNLLCLSSN